LKDITILGIQPIGISLALSIKNSSLEVNKMMAYSENSDLINSAKSLDIFDDVSKDIKKSINESSLIIIDSPLIEIPLIFEAINNSSTVKTVLNLNGSQVKCMDWANEKLDKNINYLGIRPILKTDIPTINDASDLVLEDLNICLMPKTTTDNASIQNIVHLIEKIGATPYFLDVIEHDSYFTAMDKLSDVISAAYINATTAKSSWIEMYKSAGIEFDHQSKNATKDPITNEAECLTLSDPLSYWIDEMIISLTKFKKTLKSENDDLLNYLVNAWEQKAKWESGAMSQTPDSPHLPSAAEAMGNSILGSKLSKRLSGNQDTDKRHSWKYPKQG
tara:strand:- start:4855 stop:5853 length:999 start_codon:yes stop_codon:yes gene_type:complete